MLLFVSGLISGLIAGGLLASIVVVTCLKRHTNAAISGELLELSKLTGELAHEIRNPLSTIKVNLKLAFEQLEAVDTNSHEAVRALRKIGIVQAETDRLQKILDGFLQYIGKPELQLERIDLNELISDIVDFYSPQAYNHNVTLRMSVLDAPLPVHVDTAMLKQVILNMSCLISSVLLHLLA